MSDNAGAQILRRHLRRHNAAMVAVECLSSVEMVDHWANGRVIPEYHSRRILARLFENLPVTAWLEPPGELIF